MVEKLINNVVMFDEMFLLYEDEVQFVNYHEQVVLEVGLNIRIGRLLQLLQLLVIVDDDVLQVLTLFQM